MLNSREEVKFEWHTFWEVLAVDFEYAFGLAGRKLNTTQSFKYEDAYRFLEQEFQK